MVKECVYLQPEKEKDVTFFFREIISFSSDPRETFKGVLAFFNREKKSIHRFQFKYLIGGKEMAETFFKVMEIKAQEAHRFVPVFSACEFIYPRHLGFLRKATMKNGIVVWEHTLIDKRMKSILFIEEKQELSSGQSVEGRFAALNAVTFEGEQCYFSGTYLFHEPFSKEQVHQTEEMFHKTYENMMAFISSGQIDSVYAHLHKY